jgi:hypothetical protein
MYEYKTSTMSKFPPMTPKPPVYNNGSVDELLAKRHCDKIDDECNEFAMNLLIKERPDLVPQDFIHVRSELLDLYWCYTQLLYSPDNPSVLKANYEMAKLKVIQSLK